jgi:hypothetical protein
MEKIHYLRKTYLLYHHSNMSSLALMSGAESLKAQIMSLAENGEAHKAFLVSHALSKIADGLKKEYQPLAVEYWNTNKELPA